MGDSFSPPGSSTYSSSTQHVGDGTWDYSRNDFLLPNLVGLNFATMQYNGMGNRFRDLPEYHVLVKAHGVMAAITFLLLIPSAILIARFYHRNPRMALRLHIALNIFTVFFITVVLVLGWFAVGPERSLTNPHHGIGVALYTLVLVQAIGGALVHRIEKGKMRYKLPLKLFIHQWLGRTIALLGIAQVALGLTLYGSPKYLFILYALAVFIWLVLYFVLSYHYQGSVSYGSEYGTGSYLSGQSAAARTEITEDRRSRRDGGSHWLRNTALLGGGFAALTKLRERSRRRREEREAMRTANAAADAPQQHSRSHSRPRSRPRSQSRSRPHSRHTSGSYVEEEKILERPPTERHTWRNRLLGAGVGLGAYEGVKRLWGSKRRDEESDVGSYGAPLGGNHSVSRMDVSRVEAGQAPFSPGNPQRTERVHTVQVASPLASPTRPMVSRPIRPGSRRGPRSRRSDSLDSYDSRSSFESVPERRQGLTQGQTAAGGLGLVSGLFGLRQWSKRRKERREDERLDEIRRMDEDNAQRINRVNSQRRRNRLGEGTSVMEETTETAPEDVGLMGSNPSLSRHNLPNTNRPPLPISAAALPQASINQTDSEAVYSGVGASAPTTSIPATSQPSYPVGQSAVSMPNGAIEPDPGRLVNSDASRRNSRSHLGQEAAASAAGLAAGKMLSDRQRRRRSRSSSRHTRESFDSSVRTGNRLATVKMKLHNDNQHVTLRRLSEEEAAAERARMRTEKRRNKKRTESLSSGVEDEGTRFRRRAGKGTTGITPAASIPITNVPPPPTQPPLSKLNGRPTELNLPSPQNYPAPPPVPAHASPHGANTLSPGAVSGVTSGGYDTGTGTEMSAFDDNRRRRRAERAAAKQRAAQQGARVDFT